MGSRPRSVRRYFGGRIWILNSIQDLVRLRRRGGLRRWRRAPIDTVIHLRERRTLREIMSSERLMWWLYAIELRHAGAIRRFFEGSPVWLNLPGIKPLYMRAVVKEVQQLVLLEKTLETRKRIAAIPSSPYLSQIRNLRLTMRCQIAMRREVKALAAMERLLSDDRVGSYDFAEAIRICNTIGSPSHTRRVAASWARFSGKAFEDRFVRQIVTTLPDFQKLVDWGSAGGGAEASRYLPELLMPKLCQDYRPRSDFRPGLIVEVTSSLGPGGAERQFVNSLKALMQAAAAHVLTQPPVAILYRARFRDLGFFLNDLLYTGVTVHEASRISREEAIELLLDQSAEAEDALNFIELLPRNAQVAVLRYYYLLMQEKPEIVQIWQDDTNILCGIAALLARVPRISFFTRSKRPIKFTRHRRYLRSCYKYFLGLPNVSIINNSQSGGEDYAKWLDLPRDRVLTVYNGIDIDAFVAGNTELARQKIRDDLDIPAGAFVVGGVMRMSAEKQPLLWLEVALRLAERFPDAHFTCLGDGPLADEMRQMADASPHRARIHLPGSVHGVASWYDLMTLVICTSSVEGLPNIPIEAQSLGVPVVATDAGGTRETFVDGETGFLCPIGDAEALSAAAAKVLLDVAWRDRARELGMAHCREKFDFSSMRRSLLHALGLAATPRSTP